MRLIGSFLILSITAFGQISNAVLSSPADVTPGIVADWSFATNGVTNIVQQSQIFTGASWTVSSTTVAASGGGVTDPFGSNLAYTMTEPASGNVAPEIFQSTTGSSGAWTASAYLKMGTATWAELAIGNTRKFAWVNLSTGALGTVQSPLTASSIPVGGGWYRVAITTPSDTPGFMLIVQSSANGTSGCAPCNSSTTFIYGAQVNAGSSAAAYQPTDFFQDLYGNTAAFTWSGTRPTYSPYLSMTSGSAQLGTTSFVQPSSPMSVVILFDMAAPGANSRIISSSGTGALTVYVTAATGTVGVCSSATCLISNGSFTGSPAILVFAYDGTTAKIYRNGLLDISHAETWTFPSTVITVSASSDPLIGTCYRLRFYNAALTSAQAYQVTFWMRGIYNHYPTPVSFTLAQASSLAEANRIHRARQLGVTFCYNMSTFQGVQYATPNQSVNTFSPTGLNMNQWLAAAAAGGAGWAAITTKHLDGFALWPTAFAVPTFAPYDVAQTTWYAANGSPDLVQMFVNATVSAGLHPAIYFSIQDNTYEIRSGTTAASGTAAYISMIESQLHELLTNYGNFEEIILDGWGNTGPVTTPGMGGVGGYTYIPWATIYNYIHSLQPNILVVSDAELSLGDMGFSECLSITPCAAPSAPPGNEPYEEIWDYVQNWFLDTSSSIQTSASMSSRLKASLTYGWTYLVNMSVNTAGIVPTNQTSVFSAITHN